MNKSIVAINKFQVVKSFESELPYQYPPPHQKKKKKKKGTPTQ